MGAMNRGFYLAAVVSAIGFAVVTVFYLDDWRPFWATIAGLVLAVVLDKVTEYFTSTHFNPVQEVSKQTASGPATTILSGLALGMESSVWAVVVIAASIMSSVVIYGGYSDDPAVQLTAVLYGVALTGIGMLTLTGNTISMDSFGPISDNANSIGEMAGLNKQARAVMDDLDAVGNTTKAVTKGIAIGSAVIAAVALFGSYLADVGKVQSKLVALIIAPIVVQFRAPGEPIGVGVWLVSALYLVGFGWAYWQSKREDGEIAVGAAPAIAHSNGAAANRKAGSTSRKKSKSR